MADTSNQRKKLLFVVTEDWAFLRHRLPMARAALDQGFEVAVATQGSAGTPKIEALGIQVFKAPVHRATLSPLADLRYMARLRAICRAFRPDLIHNVSVKPILFGTLAGRSAGVPTILNAFTGMSILFHDTPGSDAPPIAPWKGRLFLRLLRLLATSRRVRFLVQNADDETFVHENICHDAGRVFEIPGSGVDTTAFPMTPEPASKKITATLVGRLLWTKGVGEFVEAARLLHQRGVDVRMVLVGAPDPANPTTVGQGDLKDWVREGLVEWWGERTDIADIWAQSHVAVLPSYREGLPKSLLEAASSGRPMIATDVPGCRALVRHEETGLLCPAGDPASLADAIQRLALSPGVRCRMGLAAREDVEQRLSAAVVGQKIGRLYRYLAGLPDNAKTAG